MHMTELTVVARPARTAAHCSAAFACWIRDMRYSGAEPTISALQRHARTSYTTQLPARIRVYCCAGFPQSDPAARFTVLLRAVSTLQHNALNSNSMHIGQHVLERTAVLVSPAGDVEGRFTVGLPAQGRSIMGPFCAQILTQHLVR
jgi:hypothetical protein